MSGQLSGNQNRVLVSDIPYPIGSMRMEYVPTFRAKMYGNWRCIFHIFQSHGAYGYEIIMLDV